MILTTILIIYVISVVSVLATLLLKDKEVTLLGLLYSFMPILNTFVVILTVIFFISETINFDKVIFNLKKEKDSKTK